MEKYIIRVVKTKSGKKVIKIFYTSHYKKPVELDASVILKRALRRKKRKLKSKKIKQKQRRLDKNNAIEMEIIKNRRRKLLSVMRALG